MFKYPANYTLFTREGFPLNILMGPTKTPLTRGETGPDNYNTSFLYHLLMIHFSS